MLETLPSPRHQTRLVDEDRPLWEANSDNWQTDLSGPRGSGWRRAIHSLVSLCPLGDRKESGTPMGVDSASHSGRCGKLSTWNSGLACTCADRISLYRHLPPLPFGHRHRLDWWFMGGRYFAVGVALHLVGTCCPALQHP